MMLYDEEEVPEARFAYNISPMSVLVRSEKRPWYDFVTKVLAIVGGTFSVVSGDPTTLRVDVICLLLMSDSLNMCSIRVFFVLAK